MPSVESAQRSGQRTPFGAAEKVANWQRNVYYIYGGTISAVQWARGVGRPVREVTCETTTKNGQSGWKTMADGASVLDVVPDAKTALPEQGSDTVWDSGTREAEGLRSWQQV